MANMSEPLQFKQALRGELRSNEPMSKHTSWRAGGVAQRAYLPADLQDLAVFISQIPAAEPIYIVGLGSNLLVRDGGIEGTIILIHDRLKKLSIVKEGPVQLIYAEAGVPSPKVARFAALHDLIGAEFLAGIPGTMGGALAMNAGCYGSETWEVVNQVQVIDRNGELIIRKPEEFDIAYRHVYPKQQRDEWFVAAWLKLKPGDGETSRKTIKELLTRRIASQPLNLPNAGSVFRNPGGEYAARLIESCGLKGFKIGGAQISEKHANFIVNPEHTASARDIEMLIQHIQATVETKCGIKLEPEVRIIGEAL
jgi:UDP-N-acetylmuramate dehydrogenase